MKGTMKAARLHELNGPILIDEIPIPEIGPNDVLIRVMASHLNGGDRHVWCGEIMPGILPMVVNHECGGIIEDVGSEVKAFKKGDRVVGDPMLSCMQASCHYCQTGEPNYCPHRGCPGMRSVAFKTELGARIWEPYADGGMAEFWKIPAYCCTIIPDNVPFDQGAKMGLAVAYRAVEDVGIQLGDTVVCNACTGASGPQAIKLALLRNPGMVIAIGRSEKKLEKIKSWAPDIIQTISSAKENVHDRIMQLTGDRGADRLIDYSPTGGEDIALQCLNSLRNRAKAVIVGAATGKLNLDFGLFTFRGIHLTGSVANHRDDVESYLRLLSRGMVDCSDCITHRFPLARANEAFDTFFKRIGDPMWIMVLPQEKD